MSIALSATIRASPALRMAQAALCAALLAGATLVADAAASALLLAGGVVGAGCCRGNVKAARIDISGGGGIRLTVYRYLDTPCGDGAERRAAEQEPIRQSISAPLPEQMQEPLLVTMPGAMQEPGRAVELLPGSTLWPALLLLRLREVGGGTPPRTWWLAVLPDSAAPDVRRRLALAARAIAARH